MHKEDSTWYTKRTILCKLGDSTGSKTVHDAVKGQYLVRWKDKVVQYEDCTWYSRRTRLATFLFITEKIGERLTT